MAGAPTGWSDYIGWRSVMVTPDMVGRRCAIFCAVEMKQPGKKRSPEQINFQRVVVEDGGIAACCSSELDAIKLLEDGK